MDKTHTQGLGTGCWRAEHLNTRRLCKIGLPLSIAAAGFVFFGVLDGSQYVVELMRWIDGLGWRGAFLFAVLFVLGPVVFFPITVLSAGAGMLFGFWRGFFLVSVCATLSAVLTFIVGRYFIRGWVARKAAGDIRYRAMDEAVAEEGWKIVCLSRFSPVLPFAALNYFFGATKISLKAYTWATWLAMLPGAAFYVYLGTLMGSFSFLTEKRPEISFWHWALYGMGLAATAVLLWFISAKAKAAIEGAVRAHMENVENGRLKGKKEGDPI